MNMSKVVGLCMALVVSTLAAMESQSQTPQGWVVDAAETPAPLDLGSSSSSSAQTGGLPRVLSQASLANLAAQTTTTPASQSTGWFSWPSWLSWSSSTTVPADSTVATPSPAAPAVDAHVVAAAIVQHRSSRSTPLSDDQFPALPGRQESGYESVSSQTTSEQALETTPRESWAQRVGSNQELHTLAQLVVAERSASSPLPGADSPARILVDFDPLSQSTGDISRQRPQKKARKRAAHRRKKNEQGGLPYRELVEEE